jgi:hypothetical protein
MYFSASRDYVDFFFLAIVPALFLLSLLCIGIAAFADWRSRGVKIGLLILLATPIFALATFRFHDDIRFVLWSAVHGRDLDRAAKKDAVITAWDSWGMAGLENDSYLVSDISDDNRSVAAAEQWRKHMRLKCPIVATERMAARIYMVTTSNCSF